MSLKRIYAIYIRQWFLIKSNPVRLANIFLWLLIDIFLWGYISKYLSTLGQATFSFVTVVLGAIILWEFLSRMQQGIMTSFLEEIWSNNFVNFFASPLKIKEYVAGMVLTSIMTTAVGFLAMVLVAGLVFGYNILLLGFYIFPFILILFIFGVAIGIFISGVVFNFGPSAEWLAWPIPLLLSIISGVYYPLSTLPLFLQAIAKIFPTAYVFESMRTVVTSNNPASNIDLLIGLLLALAYLFLAYIFFIKIYQRNLKNGGIARFNAV
ncbi:MAG: ABC-2 type transporter [Candidatus Falkowbacteria bacterium GW2011_GWF2_39_8]|uniref:Transport permease protein n=1 Tax=Candidatus Falkowbacteria bacterium GW2011_GWF2_39_8 TaxID=1618642 RepID=A0A0G0T4B8_9BACT|nr:MAG: ABC-2 type transporter [Candidatus Falkowbacteria bacterium GW2011_GWF2_39_8]